MVGVVTGTKLLAGIRVKKPSLWRGEILIIKDPSLALKENVMVLYFKDLVGPTSACAEYELRTVLISQGGLSSQLRKSFAKEEALSGFPKDNGQGRTFQGIGSWAF